MIIICTVPSNVYPDLYFTVSKVIMKEMLEAYIYVTAVEVSLSKVEKKRVRRDRWPANGSDCQYILVSFIQCFCGPRGVPYRLFSDKHIFYVLVFRQ